MKELSIEEKAKRYDEALEELRGLLEGIREEKCKILEEDITSIFPELLENEDERIRKELIFYLGDMPEDTELRNGVTNRDVLAWLEKQGTQPRYNIGDVICDKLCTTLNKEAQPNMAIVDIQNGMYICDKGSFPVSQQDEYVLVSKKIDMKPVDSVSNELRTASFAHAEREMKNQTFHDNKEFELAYTFEEGAKWDAAQKPTWSEEYIADVFEKVGLAKIVREQSNDALVNALQDAMIELSKVTLQPKPSTWSEEDEQITLSIEQVMNCASLLNIVPEKIDKIKTWLKSLKQRYAWKPSDEQMDALQYVYKNLNPPLSDKLGWNSLKTLELMYHDLKKLK